ncbi:DUF2007 domain-containing protein [Hyunsoonleella flava]|uniref:DUF2007 domain-containing protein n=1 Tax=Hyunsoonleella flava TaxID=2527939 RepID=A0A4Q9FDF8_9FLAO|nr:DUF2007 domain-containing protein [Hyunsoonleella flava]TBM99744.1 DUF2007 domain-containing protein [Hyunsoonleella flava]
MELITIKKARVESDLVILKSRLESEGIECFLKNEFTTQLMNYIPTFEIELQVRESDLEKVRKIMSGIENSQDNLI